MKMEILKPKAATEIPPKDVDYDNKEELYNQLLEMVNPPSTGLYNSIEEVDAIVLKVKELLQDEKFEPTAQPAIEFHMANFLSLHPDAKDEEIERELLKVHGLSDLEEEAKDKKALPTIGIEIEIPEQYVFEEKKYLLTSLGIKHESVNDASLYEVNPSFSYSPWVSARILQELATSEMLPVKTSEDGKEKMIEPGSLSLHINFGIPPEVVFYDVNRGTDDTKRIVDLLTYAFVSGERIQNRKTNKSHYIKYDASLSDKNSKNGNIMPENPDTIRFEVRTTEFKDYTTFRLLAESQAIVALHIADLKREQGVEITRLENHLANIYMDFKVEYEKLFKKHKVETQVYDWSKYKAEVIMSEKEFIAVCRDIISKYGREAIIAIDKESSDNAR